jgi:hypothetical protein
MRTRPLGKTWRRNRRRNSSTETVIDPVLAAMGIVSPAEGDEIVLEGHEAMVGDGDAKGVAAR